MSAFQQVEHSVITFGRSALSSALNEARFTFFREGQDQFLHPQTTNWSRVPAQCVCPGRQLCFMTAEAIRRSGFTRDSAASRGKACPFRHGFTGAFQLPATTLKETAPGWQTRFNGPITSAVIGTTPSNSAEDFRYQKFSIKPCTSIKCQPLGFWRRPNDPGFGTLNP